MAFSTIVQNFQFAIPFWLWGLALIPVIWILYTLYYRQGDGQTQLERFADPHLLPHLMAEDEQKGRRKQRIWLSLLAWSLLWTFGLLAMAGPRWDYTEVKAYAPANNLVILLDLSRSMDVQDVKPSRLARAKQEIEDINRMTEGVNIGLIAFASVPHVITPLTDDKETMSRLLPSLKTDLVYTQGSNLSPALKRAGTMLENELGKEKHVLVVSDGDFSDGDASIFKAGQELIKQGVRVHVMGMGTAEGAPVPDGKGGYAKENGTAVISRLEQDRLSRIAEDSKGAYLEASYLENDTRGLLARIGSAAESEGQKTARFWEERFYLFLAPLVLLLPWFRRNAAFPVLILFFLQPAQVQAFEWRDLFLNKAQQGKAAIEQQKYEQAAGKFDDPYRRGVAQYKAGQYEQAAQSFSEVDRPDVAMDAQYNLGNAQLMKGHIQNAIESYEKILESNSDHKDAAHNLKIAKKMLQQQEQKQDRQQSNQDQQSQQQNQEQEGSQQQEGKQEQEQKQDSKKSGRQETGQQGDNQEQKKAGNETDQSGKQDEAENKGQNEQNQVENKKTSENQQGRDIEQPSHQAQRTQKDINADQWLNRIENDPEAFLKNKFYIESKRQDAQEGEQRW